MLKVPIRLPEMESALLLSSADHWMVDNDNFSADPGQFVTLRKEVPASQARQSVFVVSRWLVDEMESIKPGQVIAEVMGQSGLTHEVKSPHYGVIISHLVAAEETLHAGQCICMISDAGDVCSNRGGIRFKLRTSAWRHQQVAALLAAGLKL